MTIFRPYLQGRYLLFQIDQVRALFVTGFIILFLFNRSVCQPLSFLDSIEALASESELDAQKGLALAILAIEYSTSNKERSNEYFDLLKETRFNQNHQVAASIAKIIEGFQKFDDGIKIPLSDINGAITIFEKHDLYTICGYAQLLAANYDYLDKDVASMKEKLSVTLAYFERASFPKGIADCYHIFGIVSRFGIQFDLAISHFKKAIRSYELIKSRVQMQALLNLASTFQASNELDSAVLYYQKAELQILRYNYPSLEAFLYSNWASIYDVQGDSLRADSLRNVVVQLTNKYSEETYEDYDFPSFFNLGKNIRSKKKIQNAVTSWREEKNKLLLQQLAMKNKLSESKIKLQRLGLASALVIGLMLIFFIYTLKKKNGKIERQNKEKDTLLREIHHRVKNNLQIISSLLNLQTQKTKDNSAVQALMEGQSRVQSMSLIHQNLYQQNDLTAIDMPAYLTKLIGNLAETYHISETSIEIHQHVDPLLLDVDTVVPLGLIINELITNSIKYAFPNRNGRIEVQLKKQPTHLYLSVSDNGIGFNHEDAETREGFGYEMIHAFSDQLEADLKVDQNYGTHVSFQIRNFQIYDKS